MWRIIHRKQRNDSDEHRVRSLPQRRNMHMDDTGPVRLYCATHLVDIRFGKTYSLSTRLCQGIRKLHDQQRGDRNVCVNFHMTIGLLGIVNNNVALQFHSFCGDTKPPIIMTQSNELTLIFRSDSTITREGFTATYLFLDARKSCGGHFVKVTGVIQSPNYPKNYPNKRECTWVIEAPSKQKVLLNVTNFHLENHPNCDFDYLEIR